MFARAGYLSTTAVIAVGVVALSAGAAQAVTYGFRDITSAKPDVAKSKGLAAGVVPSGNDLYNLSESGPLPSYIGKVYWGDSAGKPGHAGAGGPGKGGQGAGGNGGDPATPAQSAGERVSAASGTSHGQGHGQGAGGPGASGKGFGLGAAPGFASASGGGGGFGDALSAIDGGTPGAGLGGHASALNATSDWSADDVSTVPLPASILFLISALGGLWFVGQRKRSHGSGR